MAKYVPEPFTLKDVDLTRFCAVLDVDKEQSERFSLAEGEWRATMTEEQVARWLGLTKTVRTDSEPKA